MRKVLSNNTAEMQAVIETLLSLLAHVEQEVPVLKLKDAAVIHSDSKYVVELITHGSRSKTNIVMRDFLSHQWKAAKDLFDLHIVWIRGHTQDFGNDLADKHAGEAAEDKQDSETRWRPTDWGFTELRREHPIHFASGKTTARAVFENAGMVEDVIMRKKHRKGKKRKASMAEQSQAETQGRAEDQERNLKPNLVEIQAAGAVAAAAGGRPKRRGNTKLALDHPAMIDLTEATILRSMAAHQLERFAFNRRVAKCGSIVRRLVKTAQA